MKQRYMTVKNSTGTKFIHYEEWVVSVSNAPKPLDENGPALIMKALIENPVETWVGPGYSYEGLKSNICRVITPDEISTIQEIEVDYTKHSFTLLNEWTAFAERGERDIPMRYLVMKDDTVLVDIQ